MIIQIFDGGSTNRTAASTTVLSAGTWYFVCAVWDSDNVAEEVLSYQP